MTTHLRFVWIGVGVIGLIVSVIFGAMWLRRVPPKPPFDATKAHIEWVNTIQAQVSSLASTARVDQIRTVREALVGLTVAGSDREAHFALVMGLLAWERGESGAEAKVRDLAKQIY